MNPVTQVVRATCPKNLTPVILSYGRGVRVLAIDQGTSATKAVVVDSGAGIVSEVDVALTGQRFAGDAVEQDPMALWESVVTAGKAALKGAEGQVDCLGVGNQGETVLAWRRSTGEPVTTAIVWQDSRAATVTDRLRVGSSRVDLQACKLEYSIVSPK